MAEETANEPAKEYVTKDTLIGEVVQRYPKAAFVMMRYGLHCVGCHVSAYETVEQGCQGHGMPEETLREMLTDINELIAKDEGVLAGAEQHAPKPAKE